MPTEALNNDQSDANKGTEDSANVISNADLKSHPVFQKLASKLANYEKAEDERRDAERRQAEEAEVKKRDEELKKLEEESRFKEALEMRERELEKVRNDARKQILGLKLENSLIGEGYKNPYFLKGVISGFDGDEAALQDYVQKITNDEANRIFKESQAAGATIDEPGLRPPSAGNVAQTSTTMPVEKLRAMEQSSDRNERMKARQILKEYREKHGKYPY